LLAGLLLTAGAVGNLLGVKKGPYPAGIEQPSFREVCDFLRAHGDKAGLVISWNPRVVGLYADLPSAWYPFLPQDVVFDEYLKRVDAKYVLVYTGNEDDRQWLLPHLQHQPQSFRILFQNSAFLVYGVHWQENSRLSSYARAGEWRASTLYQIREK
jgi:hypothetical protein